MNYETFFAAAVDRLREEQRYRVFVDLQRIAGRFPYAIWRSSSAPREVVICSNDYLGMGQHPKVIKTMLADAACFGPGAGGTHNIAGTNHIIHWSSWSSRFLDLHRKDAALVFTSGYVSEPDRRGRVSCGFEKKSFFSYPRTICLRLSAAVKLVARL
jgi:5-aminolevulinate synthase